MSELADLFARIARDMPDRVLIHAPALDWSVRAAELWEHARGLASALERAGAGAGSLAALAAGNHPGTFAAWLACRMRDIAVMPLDRGSTDAEVRELHAAFRPCVSIERAEGEGSPDAPMGLRIVQVDPVLVAPGAYQGAAVLKLTSGTTGQPKAVWTTETQLITDSAQIAQAMDIRPGDTQLGAIPLSHAYGIGNVVVPLLVQGTRVVLRDSFVPQQVPRDAAAFGARVFCGVPFMFEHFLQHAPAAGWPPGLRRLISAGARLDRATQLRFLEAFGVPVGSFYGASEAGGIAFDPGDGVAAEDFVEGVLVGAPLPGVTVTLRPADVEDTATGRVHVKSRAVAGRYVGPGAEADAFVDGGFLTGDLGRFDARGRLVLTGRVSGFVNVAGRKVQPEEVERVLRTMPQVAEAHVLGVADNTRGEMLVACLVPRHAAPTIFEVRHYCSQYLSPHKVPRWAVILDAVPLTGRGKPDRRRLHELALASLAQPGPEDVT